MRPRNRRTSKYENVRTTAGLAVDAPSATPKRIGMKRSEVSALRLSKFKTHRNHADTGSVP
jgi:hypothetical protein